MVPDVELDLIVYINQGVPTKVSKSLIGTPNDISVESLAVWGIVKENQYSLSGALTFESATDAEVINTRLPKQSDVWTKLSDRTIYFVQGTGAESEAVKTAISNNNLKRFDDRGALDEISNMPAGGVTRPAAFAIIRPNQAMLDLIKRYTNENTAKSMEDVFNGVKPQIIVLGLYSTQPLDIADLMQRAANNTIWDVDIGVLASISSVYPGIVFSPIATRALDNQGYPKETINNLTVYKTSIAAGSGKTVTLLINIDGNHIFTAVSAKEPYAETLLLGIKR